MRGEQGVPKNMAKPQVEIEVDEATGCYMFGPWLQGAFEFVMTSAGRPTKLAAREVYCAAEGEHDHCLFEVAPEA
jgi:hypothetical protein